MDGTHREGTGGIPAAEGVTTERNVRIPVGKTYEKTKLFQMVESKSVPFSYYSKKSTLIPYGPCLSLMKWEDKHIAFKEKPCGARLQSRQPFP